MKIFFGVLGALIAFSILRTIASNLVPQPTEAELRMEYLKRELEQSSKDLDDAFKPLRCANGNEPPENCK